MGPIVLGIVLTFGFIALGVLGKLVARGLRIDDTYLGMEMGLAAVAAAVGYLLELGRAIIAANLLPNNGVENERLNGLFAWDAAFLVLAFICYIFVVVLHHNWEDAINDRMKNIMLIGVANFFGAAMLFAFIVYVKKGA